MNISNVDWIHVNRFIRSSPNGSSQDRTSEVYTIAGLEPVPVIYQPACAPDRFVLPGVRVVRMLENSGRVISPGSGRLFSTLFT